MECQILEGSSRVTVVLPSKMALQVTKSIDLLIKFT